jgi:acyl-coenzyme A thioesterase PaaI-like protein
MTGQFAAATAVTPAGDRTWHAEIRPGWDIGGNANGGYLLAIGARALMAATGRPDPVTVTAHYLAPGRPGPVTVDTTVIREGRRFADGSAVLGSAGTPLVSFLGTFGDLGVPVDGSDDRVLDGAPPDLPPPDECVRMGAGGGTQPTLSDRIEVRLHPDDFGFTTGRPSGVARVTGWFRLPHDEPVDTVGLLLALDVFPPAVFNTGLPVGWVPTLELTTHVRARPAPGWLRCRFTTRFVTGGFLEEDGEVWDDDGRLIAQSRQLALVPRGR